MKCLSDCSDKLLEFLRLVACVYQPEAQPPGKLLAEALPAPESQPPPAALVLPTVDVASFDLQFSLSSDNDDDDFDTSADMFL